MLYIKSAMLPSEARLCPGTAGFLALPGSTYLVPVKNQKSAMPSEARLCPGTARLLASLRENTLVSCQNQTTAMLRAHAALPWKVFGERCGKHFFSKKGFPRKSSFHSFIFSFFSFFIPLFFPFPISISRSGRRGRMRRHMRDNMASRGRDTGKLRPEGGHRPLLAPGTAGSLATIRSTISVCCQCSRVATNLLPRILACRYPAPVFLQTRQPNPQVCFSDPIGSGAAHRAEAVRGAPARVSLSSNRNEPVLTLRRSFVRLLIGNSGDVRQDTGAPRAVQPGPEPLGLWTCWI